MYISTICKYTHSGDFQCLYVGLAPSVHSVLCKVPHWKLGILDLETSWDLTDELSWTSLNLCDRWPQQSLEDAAEGRALHLVGRWSHANIWSGAWNRPSSMGTCVGTQSCVIKRLECKQGSHSPDHFGSRHRPRLRDSKAETHLPQTTKTPLLWNLHKI